MRDARLETVIGEVLRFGSIASAALFAVGSVMALGGYRPGLATQLLIGGLVLLLATPVARVVVSVIEYARAGDWVFVALTLIVLLALAGSVIAAAYG